MKQETINQSNKVGLYGQRVYLYVEQNFDRQLKLEDVASYFHLNKCYFCSVLKKELGKTFSQIVNEVRVEKQRAIKRRKSLNIINCSLSEILIIKIT